MRNNDQAEIVFFKKVHHLQQAEQGKQIKQFLKMG